MTKKTESFRVPSLGDASPEYAALLDRRADLLARQSAAATERRDVERQITDAPEPAYRPGVAELLGESSDSTSSLRARLKELQALERDIAAALEVVRQRLQAARGAASKEVCQLVRPEYGRRVSALCDALLAVAAARAAYDDMRDELERNDVAWTSLGPMSPNFLGDATDGHVQRYLMDARGLGYYGG